MRNVSIVLLVIVTMTGLAKAAPISDGSIFLDNFDGTALDTAKWVDGGGGIPVAPVVADGEVTINTMPANASPWTCYMKSQTLDFSASPDTWVAETSFIYRDMQDNHRTDRQIILMMGAPDASTFQAIGFDLRLRQTYGNTYLLWHGYDNVDLSRTGTAISSPAITLLPNQYYKVAVEVRTADSEVDIYLNDILVDTKDLIVGVGDNAGLVNPGSIYVGAMSDAVAIDMSLDYVTVGVPEPVTLALLGAGGLFSLLRKR